MAHVDDLTFVNAAQILNSDLLYLGRPSDAGDPDKRTNIEELISRIIGPVESNANGFYVRHENGWQLCWRTDFEVTFSTDRALIGSFQYAAPFVGAPMLIPPALPTSGASYEGGLVLASLGTPFIASTPSASAATVYVWSNERNFVAGHKINGMRIGVLGRWK